MGDPSRRSRAFGVLAVSLALMALVTAISSATSRRSAPSAAVALARQRPDTIPALGHTQRGSPATSPPVERPRHPPRTITAGARKLQRSGPHAAGRALTARSHPGPAAGQPGGPLRLGGSATSASSLFATAAAESPLSSHPAHAAGTSTSDLEAGPRSVAQAPAPNDGGTEGTAATAPVHTTTSGSSLHAGTSASRTSVAGSAGTPSSRTGGVYPGTTSIVPPATSASFPAAGGGTVTASASWSGGEDLELAISCAGGLSVTRVGASPLSIELDDQHGTGTCTVAIALVKGSARVQVTLVIQPAP
jgi:hypothetical protein